MKFTTRFNVSYNQTLVVLFVPDRPADVQGNSFLTLDPNVTGVFNGPYPFGIDPVSRERRRLKNRTETEQ